MLLKSLICTLLLFTTFSACGGERLNARFFPNEHLDIAMQWAEPLHHANNRSRENIIIATTGMTELKLEIPAKYDGTTAKIYIVIPSQFQGIRDNGVEIKWESRGTFINNSAQPGSKTLLYEGPLNGAELSGQIAFTFTIDSRRILGSIEFHPEYIIE